MTAIVAIDPNVRVAGGLTFSGFEDVVGEMPAPGDEVLVREPEANLIGHAVVDRLDDDNRLIYLAVRWDSIRPCSIKIGPEPSVNVSGSRIEHVNSRGVRVAA